MTLVVSESLRHGTLAGVRIGMAPVITDLPIILLTLLVLKQLSAFHTILGGISLAAGAVFVGLMAWNSCMPREVEVDAGDAAARSWTKGIRANALSPHPYLFWVSVGGPIMMRANQHHGSGAAIAFLVTFYGCLVGAKILLALLVGRSRHLLDGAAYRNTMRLLGGMLVLVALFLLIDGLTLLGLAGA